MSGKLLVNKARLLPLFITAIMIVFLTFSNVAKADSLDNQRVVFGNGADWMKNQVALTGETMTIDMGSRFSSYLDPGSIQLQTTSQGNVSVVADGLTLKITINDFSESTIKVNAVDKNGKIEQDQFKLKVTKLGDINGDGVINPSDALYIYQVTSGNVSLSSEQLKFLDINGDGKVTNADASLLMTNYVGKKTDTNISNNNNNFFIQLSDVNDSPIANNDNFSVDEDHTLQVDKDHGVFANDKDVEKDTLTANKVSVPSHGTLTLNADGSFNYTPDANYNGKDSFTYKAYDGELYSDIQTVTVDVKPVDDAPVAKADNYTVNEDETLNVKADSSILVNDTDIENDSLTAVLVNGPSHGKLDLNADGTFSYTPAANYNGSDSFTYKANDGELNSGEQTVTIDVKPVNDAPVAKADSYTVNEDETLKVKKDTGILANDSEVDGDSITAVKVSGPSHGTLTLEADGTFSYTPSANYNGEDSFTYKAFDGDLYSYEQTVTIEVQPVNDPPVADHVSLSGNFVVGSTLMGHYTYSDIENDPEGVSTYQWYRSANVDGSMKEAISGANSIDYTLQDADLAQYVFFGFIPVAATGAQTNQESLSGPSDQIKPRDITPPTLDSSSPENQATDVSTTDNLVATFSENVVAQSGTIAIHKSSDDSVVESFKANDVGHVVVADNKVTIKHSDLDQGVSYYVTIDHDAFADMSGNAFAGLSNPTDWSFTTTVPVTLTADAWTPISEDGLKDGSGSYISLQLNGDTFKSGMSESDFNLNNAPAGVSILGVFDYGDGSAGVMLDYDGTDFDQDMTNFSITAKASATERGQEVTSNPLTITADVEPPSAYISQYVDGGDGRIALKIKPYTGDLSGYQLEVKKYMKATGKVEMESIPVSFKDPTTGNIFTFLAIDSIFYDYFDLMPPTVGYYNNDDLMLYSPNDFTLNAIVLKKDGKIVDVLGNPNSSAADQFLPNGGTLVRNPNLTHGNTMFVNGEWQQYPKGTYQYFAD